MHVVAVIIAVVAVLAFYLAMLATWSLAHDPTLTRTGRITRVMLAWLVPIAAPVAILRAAAELVPQALPRSALLWPVRWLLHDRPRPHDPGYRPYTDPGDGDGT
jgi:hypothetical protein